MVFCLAEIIAGEMQARGFTAVDVAARMPGKYATNVGVVNLILAVQSESMLLGDVCERLAVAFGVSSEFFKSIHKTWMDNPGARQAFECPENLFDGLVFPSDNDNASSPTNGGEND